MYFFSEQHNEVGTTNIPILPDEETEAQSGKCFAKVTQKVSNGASIQIKQWSFILTIIPMILHPGCALESSGELL